MAFSKGIKKLFTTPIYLFGENTEKSEEKEEEELFVEDEKGEVKWYDKVFSWPMFIVTWIVQLLVNLFLFFTDPYTIDLGQLDKPRKLKTAASPILKFIVILIRLIVVMTLLALLFIGVIGFTGWIITNF